MTTGTIHDLVDVLDLRHFNRFSAPFAPLVPVSAKPLERQRSCPIYCNSGTSHYCFLHDLYHWGPASATHNRDVDSLVDVLYLRNIHNSLHRLNYGYLPLHHHRHIYNFVDVIGPQEPSTVFWTTCTIGTCLCNTTGTSTTLSMYWTSGTSTTFWMCWMAGTCR